MRQQDELYLVWQMFQGITSSGEVTTPEIILRELLNKVSSIDDTLKRIEGLLIFLPKDKVQSRVQTWLNTTIDLEKKKEQRNG